MLEKFLIRLQNESKGIVDWVGSLGRVFFLSLYYVVVPPYRFRLFFQQLRFLGNGSLAVVVLTGSFTGMVLALQMYAVLKKFNAESMVGAIVALSLTRELGPVLTALMVNARAGSAMAAELASMRVTDQIMAMEAMAVNSYQYLISPRIFAGIVMMPLLTVIACLVGIVGGYIIAVFLMGLDPGLYISKIDSMMYMADIWGGLFKAAIFGAIVSLIGSYQGFHAGGGAEGVGRATTSAVVISSVMILAFDYVITSFII